MKKKKLKTFARMRKETLGHALATLLDEKVESVYLRCKGEIYGYVCFVHEWIVYEEERPSSHTSAFACWIKCIYLHVDQLTREHLLKRPHIQSCSTSIYRSGYLYIHFFFPLLICFFSYSFHYAFLFVFFFIISLQKPVEVLLDVFPLSLIFNFICFQLLVIPMVFFNGKKKKKLYNRRMEKREKN